MQPTLTTHQAAKLLQKPLRLCGLSERAVKVTARMVPANKGVTLKTCRGKEGYTWFLDSYQDLITFPDHELATIFEHKEMTLRSLRRVREKFIPPLGHNHTLLATRISDQTSWTDRDIHALLDAGFYVVMDLVHTTEGQLRYQYGLPKGTRQLVRLVLNDIGLKLSR